MSRTSRFEQDTLQAFCKVYTPAAVSLLSKDNERRCVLTERSPYLSEFADKFGKRAASIWIASVLHYYNEMTTSNNKMNAYQIKACSEAIASEYYYLKASEILLFFQLMMAGRFGKVVYGGLDAYSICASIRADFLPVRAFWIERQENERREAERELWAKNKAFPERAEGIIEEVANKLLSNDKSDDKLDATEGDGGCEGLGLREARDREQDECELHDSGGGE